MTLHPVILPLSPEAQCLRGRDRVQAQSLRAREALALSCEASDVTLGPLRKDHRDAPLPFNGPTYWSLSHKTRYVAAVVGPTALGIDIEEITPRNEALYGYLADEAEWSLAHNRGWEMFFRFWTAKEAVLKAVGIGLVHLSKVRIHAILDEENLLVDYDARVWPVCHLRFQDHLVALMHDEHAVVWHRTPEER